MAWLAVMPLLLAGCSESGGEPEGSCPLALDYEGRTYYALKTEKPVKGWTDLAEVGFSSCADSGGQDEPGIAEAEDAAARFEARTLEGIDPGVAFVVPSEWPRYLFYSGPSGASDFPPGVERLLNRGPSR
jgi:hypothetical protein